MLGQSGQSLPRSLRDVTSLLRPLEVLPSELWISGHRCPILRAKVLRECGAPASGVAGALAGEGVGDLPDAPCRGAGAVACTSLRR